MTFQTNPISVLIVDRDDAERALIRAVVERSGFDAVEAIDGAEALALFRHSPADLVVMDGRMAGMDGFAACEAIRDLPQGASVPILILAKRTSEADFSRAFAAGATDFITKPLASAVLFHRLRHILRAHAERVSDQQKAQYLASHDSLTELPNKMLFMNHLNALVRQALRRNGLVAMMVINIDRFKRLNDTLGHYTGDMVLAQIGARLSNFTRRLSRAGGEGAMAARLDGDEFVICLPLNRVSDAARHARTVLAGINAVIAMPDQPIYATASIGLAIAPHDGTDDATLLKNAASAAREARREGGDQYLFYSVSMNATAVERLLLENNLRAAIEHKGLTVLYQPQIDIASGLVTGAEALVRWDHPQLGSLSPASFISLAEEAGMIGEIGSFVLERACADASSWTRLADKPLKVAVNISGPQFWRDDIVGRVARILDETGLLPQSLIVEVTESLAMQDLSTTVAAMHGLKKMGVGLALDDFGTGYSSLSHLKQFPVDAVKLDRGFVSGLPDNAEDAALVSAMIGMAKSLRLKVLAEGVETAAQLEFLRNCGCDLYQGYYFAPAVPSDEIISLTTLA